MPNTCGEYVYNLWKQRGETCVSLSTTCVYIAQKVQTACAHPQLIRRFIPHSSRYESTGYQAILSLLIPSYTHNPQPLLLTLRMKN